jgi:hypothetical protein
MEHAWPWLAYLVAGFGKLVVSTCLRE